MNKKTWVCILEPRNEGTLTKFTKAWTTFINENANDIVPTTEILFKEWKGTLINDVIVFDTEQDKMWFLLRYS